MYGLAAPSTVKVTRDEDALVLHWGNGQESAFPHYWLRENAPENRHPVTGRKLTSFLDRQDELSPWSVCIEYDETLVIAWAGLREVSPASRWTNCAARRFSLTAPSWRWWRTSATNPVTPYLSLSAAWGRAFSAMGM